MNEYVNKKTGATLLTNNVISGGDWVLASELYGHDNDMTVPQIKEKLQELGIQFDSKANKAELLALLKEQE